MVQGNLLKVLCIRHGKTAYTGVLPDLTSEGAKHVGAVARGDIARWLADNHITHEQLCLISSVAPRARGTAELIARVIRYPLPILFAKGLAPIKWRDPERALSACKGLSGKGYIDYETEPVFADPLIFETPAEIRIRWYDYLVRFVSNSFYLRTQQHATILVSHYEVLCNVVHDIFGIVASEETALGHAEPIELVIRCPDQYGMAMITGTFRGITRHAQLSVKNGIVKPL